MLSRLCCVGGAAPAHASPATAAATLNADRANPSRSNVQRNARRDRYAKDAEMTLAPAFGSLPALLELSSSRPALYDVAAFNYSQFSGSAAKTNEMIVL